MLSETDQTSKDKRWVIPLAWGPQGSKTERDRLQKGSNHGSGGVGSGEFMFSGAGFQFGMVRKFWKWMIYSCTTR